MEEDTKQDGSRAHSSGAGRHGSNKNVFLRYLTAGRGTKLLLSSEIFTAFALRPHFLQAAPGQGNGHSRDIRQVCSWETLGSFDC